MDFNKARCSVCFKHFCCSAHRSEHQVKCHTETFALRHNNHLVKAFQIKAQSSLHRTHHHQAMKTIMKQSQVTKVQVRLPSVKRLHGAINKRILSTSVTVMSEERRILVPVHRLRLFKALKDDNKEVISKGSDVVRKESPYVDRNVKTSTPIISPVPNDKSSQMMWNITSESNVSNYQTPSGPSPGCKSESQLLVKSTKGHMMVTPLRGIISKASKYESDSDTGPSPGGNTSRGRRVTFSSSSQMSGTGTPLESIQEVTVYEEIENTYNHIEDIRAKVRCRYTEGTEPLKKFRNIKAVFDDSTPPIKDSGFLSCVTNMFCSAIHTIPSLAPWRKTETNSMSNRSKRSRSPDEKETHYLDMETPLYKRPCYPNDLRINPIKARRAISNK